MKDVKFDIQPDMGIESEGFHLPFPMQEYRNRVNKIRKIMNDRGIETLYLTSPESMFYTTGLSMVWYAANASSKWDGNKSPGVAINVETEDVLLFQMDIEDFLLSSSVCAKEIYIKAETDVGNIAGKRYEGPGPGQDIMDLIVKDLKNKNWLKGTVALELGSYRPPTRVSMAFQEKLKAEGCTIVDGTDIVAKVRSIKSPMELNYIRKAAAIADIGQKAIADTIHGGMTELQVVGTYTKAMMDVGGENMAICQMVRSGHGKIWAGHPPASRKIMMPGEPIATDLAGVYNRYHADVGRFYSIGEPTEAYAREYEAGNVGVMKEVKRILKTGMRIKDFFKELNEAYKDLGLWDSQTYFGGYEMGIAFPPDWCGEFIYDAFIDCGDDCFLPGMSVNFETGFGVIDPIIFTENGVEFLSKAPYELIIAPETREQWEAGR